MLSSVFTVYATISNIFTCENLSSTYSPYVTCSGIVNYSFYMPAGSTIQTLELSARSLLSGLSLPIGDTCLSAIKKAICAEVYLPCLNGGNVILKN